MNHFKSAVTIGLALAFVFVSRQVTAQSEEIPERGPIQFSEYDKNGDGAISEAEFREVRGKRMASRAVEGRPMRGAASALAFPDLDANGDGKLTPDELTAGQEAQMEGRRRTRMGQGRGAGQGMGPGAQIPSFGDYDLDGDGTIDEKEFHEARAKRISERAKQGYRMRQLGNAPAFGDLDSNGDGQVSREEFAAHQAQRRESKQQK